MITLKDFDSENSADVELMDSLKLAVENSVLLMKLCPIDLYQVSAVGHSLFDSYIDTLECSDALKDYLRDCRRDF